jgi:hypothetical protein
MRFALAVSILLFGAPLLALSSVRAGIVDEIQNIVARPDDAVSVAGFRLNTGIGVIHLDEGILVPAGLPGRRPVEFAFVGSGRVELDIADEVERQQLEVFTGSETLDEDIRRAVFVVTLDEASDALVALPNAAGHPKIGEAAALLDQWRTSPERRLLDVDARLIRSAASDPLGQGSFCGYFESVNLGEFLWAMDPLAEEQLTLGQFVKPELTNRERRKASRHLERMQRQGMLIGGDVGDLGIWDTWVSASLTSPDGDPTPGTTGVESRHYRLDIQLTGKQLDLEATAAIEMDVLISGLRVITLDLAGDLVTTRVSNAEGAELEFAQSRSELTVVLDRPRSPGDELSLVVEYAGRPLNRLTSGAYAQRRPTGWYPRAGAIDRATYDVTIRWPKKFQVFASGSVTDEGVTGKKRWQRRTLDVPALGFSFEVGDFDTATGTMGDTRITVAIDRLGYGVSAGLADEVLDSVRGPLAYFESIFGPYPLDELVVVSTPRNFSQGLLGFVTLSTAGIVDWDMWGALLGFEDRRLLIAHELAHQWWGNQVGWRSYRDLWISEAVASYSALLYERNRIRVGGQPAVGRGPTTGWKSALEATTADGRPIESLGPVVMGSRLNSSLSSAAYEAIVYQKGAVVLDMLSRLYGEEIFVRMLREIVAVADSRVVSTEDMLGLLEKLGGVDLEWFSRQYIFGTGMPEILYDYRTEQLAEGVWAVEGEATQQATLRYSYRVVKSVERGLDVVREASPRIDVEGSVLVVPFQIGIESPATVNGEPNGGPERTLVSGRLVLEGTTSSFRFELDQQPEVFWLDRFQEVFGQFLSESHWPRRAAFRRGLDLRAAGDLDQAESALLAALDEPAVTEDGGWFGFDPDVEREGRQVDASIHLELARLYLDQARTEDASTQLDMAMERVRRADRWYFDRRFLPLEGRLSLMVGKPDEAYRELRRGLSNRRSAQSAEAWALLAVAAHLTDRTKDYGQACRRALDRGVDLGPLTCPE